VLFTPLLHVNAIDSHATALARSPSPCRAIDVVARLGILDASLTCPGNMETSFILVGLVAKTCRSDPDCID
jgi:hypothetical protein